MARILISEPHGDIEALLRLIVERLGHEPVDAEAGGHADLAVIEPGEGDGLAIARGLHAHNVPLLFTSIYPPTPEALELEPAAYLVKPFPLSAIERALTQTLAAHSV
jgi:hypothetical protein